jgi:hypothetical protein
MTETHPIGETEQMSDTRTPEAFFKSKDGITKDAVLAFQLTAATKGVPAGDWMVKDGKDGDFLPWKAEHFADEFDLACGAEEDLTALGLVFPQRASVLAAE